MTNDLVVAPAAWTVAQARRELVDQLQRPDFVYYVYVVDDEASRRLLGVLTLRDLLVADPRLRLEEAMRPRLAVAGPLEPADEAAMRLADHQLAALPVIGEDGRLLGAVTFDAAMGQIAATSRRDRVPRVFS